MVQKYNKNFKLKEHIMINNENHVNELFAIKSSLYHQLKTTEL